MGRRGIGPHEDHGLWDRFQEKADKRNAQQEAGQVVNTKVDVSRQLTTRNKRLLRSIHTNKEAISNRKTNTKAKDKTPTTTQPQHSDRVFTMNKATPKGRPQLDDKSSRVAEGGAQPQITKNKNRAGPRGWNPEEDQ